MFKKWRQIPYHSQIFIIVLFIALVPLVILGIFSYQTYISELKNTWDATAKGIGSSTQEQMDFILRDIRNYYVELPEDDNFGWLLEETTLPSSRFLDIRTAGKLLRRNSASYEYVKNYTFINITGDFVVSSQGILPYSEVQNQQEVQELLLKKKKHPYNNPQWYNNVHRLTSETLPKDIINLQGYLLLIRLPAIGADIEQAIIVNLDTVNIQNHLTQHYDNHSIIILDSDGAVILSSDDELSRYCTEEFASLPKNDLSSVATVGEKTTYRITVTNSLQNNLSVVVGYNQDLLYEGADRIVLLIFILILLIAVLVWFSQVGKRQIYKPVSTLAGMVEEVAPPSLTTGNEMDSLVQRVQHLVGSHNTMALLIDSQYEVIL